MDVRYPNKRPARGIKLRVEAMNGAEALIMSADDDGIQTTTDERGAAFFTLNMPTVVNAATRVTVKVRYRFLLTNVITMTERTRSDFVTIVKLTH